MRIELIVEVFGRTTSLSAASSRTEEDAGDSRGLVDADAYVEHGPGSDDTDMRQRRIGFGGYDG